MIHHALRCLAFAAPLAGFASAATIVQQENYAFVPNGDAVMTFDQFDTLGGSRILTGVTVTVVMNKTGGSFEVDNDSATSGTIDLTHSVVGSLSASGVSLLDTNLENIGASGTITASDVLLNQSIAGTSGDSTSAFDVTNDTDYIRFDPGNSSASDTGSIHAVAISGYEGSGDFTMTLNALQTVDVSGLGGLQQAFTVSSVSGSVTVTYEYTNAVPEPAGALLGGLGTILLLRRRRG